MSRLHAVVQINDLDIDELILQFRVSMVMNLLDIQEEDITVEALKKKGDVLTIYDEVVKHSLMESLPLINLSVDEGDLSLVDNFEYETNNLYFGVTIEVKLQGVTLFVDLTLINESAAILYEILDKKCIKRIEEIELADAVVDIRLNTPTYP